MRIKPLVVLSLVCSLSQAADTVASLGDSVKATQFVTAVDHSKLINGSSKLRLSQDGVVSVGTDQSPFGNPVITIHAGSVFSADTAAHGKTFSTDLVLDYTYIDGVSGPLLIRTNGWVFVAPAGGSTFWCGPQDWPSYAFDLNNYDSESSTATLSSTDSDPSCSFSGTITITRSRGKTIPTIDHVLPGETILNGSYNDFETKGFVNYVFKGPYPYATTIAYFGMGDIEFFNGSCGISGPYMGTPKHTWGIGKFQYNSYTYTFPYTDNNGSGDYTLATTSMTNGLASKSYVDSHKWDWGTQVTNKPSIPAAANDGTLTIQKNGKTLGTFGANQSSNTTVNVKGVYYAACDTAQNTSVKVATLNDSNETFVLEEGVVVYVKFTNGPYNGSMSLRIGDTTAKSMKFISRSGSWGNGSGVWYGGDTVGFIYDGNNWILLSNGYASTTSCGIVKFAASFANLESVAAQMSSLYSVGTSIAPIWVKNADTSYSTGDLVMYQDGKLYKAKQDIAANTAWNASNWQAVKVKDEFAAKSYVDSHKWDWGTQVTNAPSFVPATRKVNNHALSSDVTLSGLDISATVTSPVGGPDIVNNVQGHLSFLYQDAYNTEQNMHLKADKTEIPTVPTNVSAFNNDANYTSGQIATNIARQIIRDAVSQVNVNLQSAEDTRATLTNLITILKNL